MAGGTANPNWENQLTASTVDTVVMSQPWNEIEIRTDGTALTTVTWDGTTPVLTGSTTGVEVEPTPSGAVVILGPGIIPTGKAVTLKLISAGTPHYEVRGVR